MPAPTNPRQVPYIYNGFGYPGSQGGSHDPTGTPGVDYWANGNHYIFNPATGEYEFDPKTSKNPDNVTNPHSTFNYIPGNTNNGINNVGSPQSTTSANPTPTVTGGQGGTTTVTPGPGDPNTTTPPTAPTPGSTEGLPEGWTWGERGSKIRPDGSVEYAVGTGPNRGYGGQELRTNDFWASVAAASQPNISRSRKGTMATYDANAKRQLLKHGRPPDPYAAADASGYEKGSASWKQAFRAAFDKEQEYLAKVESLGGTLADAGQKPVVGGGLANYSRLQEIKENAAQQTAIRRREFGRWQERWNDPTKMAAMQDQRFGQHNPSLDAQIAAGTHNPNDPLPPPQTAANEGGAVAGPQYSGGGGNLSSFGAGGSMAGTSANFWTSILSGGGAGALTPLVQQIQASSENQKRQILATIPPGGARDHALQLLAQDTTGKIASAKQGLLTQAAEQLGGLGTNFAGLQNQRYLQGQDIKNQQFMQGRELETRMSIAQMQDLTQRYGIDAQTVIEANRLGFSYDQLAQQASQYQQSLLEQQTEFGKTFGQRQLEFNTGVSQSQRDFEERQREFNATLEQQRKQGNRSSLSNLFGGLGHLLGGDNGLSNIFHNNNNSTSFPNDDWYQPENPSFPNDDWYQPENPTFPNDDWYQPEDQG